MNNISLHTDSLIRELFLKAKCYRTDGDLFWFAVFNMFRCYGDFHIFVSLPNNRHQVPIPAAGYRERRDYAA